MDIVRAGQRAAEGNLVWLERVAVRGHGVSEEDNFGGSVRRRGAAAEGLGRTAAGTTSMVPLDRRDEEAVVEAVVGGAAEAALFGTTAMVTCVTSKAAVTWARVRQRGRGRPAQPFLRNARHVAAGREGQGLQIAAVDRLGGVVDVVLLEDALLADGPQRVTRVPEHVRGGRGKLVNFTKGQMGTAKVPHVDHGVLAVVGGGQLGALVRAFVVVLVGPRGRAPAGAVDGIGRGQDPNGLLSATDDGKVPDFDGAIDASAEQVLAVGVPVDGGANALVVGGDVLLGGAVVAEVPALDSAVVGAEGKLDGIRGGPLHVADAAVEAGVLVAAAALLGCISAQIAQVPQADRGIVAGGQQQVALVGVEGEAVDLARVLVQARQLDAGTVQVVEDDLAVGSRGGNVGAELAMGPLDIVDAEAVALAGRRMRGCVCVGVREDSRAQVGVVDDAGVVDADRLEDLAAGEDGVGALAVGVEGGNVEARLVGGIVGAAGTEAGAGGSAEAWGTARGSEQNLPGEPGHDDVGRATRRARRRSSRSRRRPRRVGCGQWLGDEALEVGARLVARRRWRRSRRDGGHGGARAMELR